MNTEKITVKIERGYPVTPLQPVQIPEGEMLEVIAKINKEYEPFISEINECGGYVAMSISIDGKKIIGSKLKNCTAEVLDKIQAYGR